MYILNVNAARKKVIPTRIACLMKVLLKKRKRVKWRLFRKKKKEPENDYYQQIPKKKLLTKRL